MLPMPGANVFTTAPVAAIVASASGLATRFVTGTLTRFVSNTGTTLVSVISTKFVANDTRSAYADTAPLAAFVTNTTFVLSTTCGTVLVTTIVLVNTCTVT